MRIILNQEEIEAAIEAFILDQVRVPDDDRIDIALKATRGEEGYTAEIDILPHDAPTDGTDRSVDPRIEVEEGAEHLSIGEKVLEAKQQAVLPRRRGRPPGARNLTRQEREEQDRGDQLQGEAQQAQAEQSETLVAEAEEASIEDVAVEAATNLTGDALVEAAGGAVELNQMDATETVQEPQGEAQEAIQVEPLPEAQEQVEAVQEAPLELNEAMAEDVKQADQPVEPVVEEEAQAPEPVPAPQPTRSLFANLKRDG